MNCYEQESMESLKKEVQEASGYVKEFLELSKNLYIEKDVIEEIINSFLDYMMLIQAYGESLDRWLEEWEKCVQNV